MGRDIHLYFEYKDPESEEWECLTTGHSIYIPRNYTWFEILAATTAQWNTIPPKGVPPDMAFDVFHEYYGRIKEDDQWHEGDYELGYYKRSDVDEWKKYYSDFSIVSRDDTYEWAQNPDWHTASWLNSSELSQCLDEYIKLIPAFERDEDARDEKWAQMYSDWKSRQPDQAAVPPIRQLHRTNFWKEPVFTILKASHAAMLAFEANGFQARITFWFDN